MKLVERKTLTPTTVEEAERFAETISRSALVTKEYQGKPANCFVAIQWGMELGLSPMQALQNIAVINGKPSVYGDALLAMVRADTRCRGVSETIEGEGDNRTAVCIINRCHIDGTIETTARKFSVSDAKTARLWGKQGAWQLYPERMLQHRARGNCIRDSFPDVIKGLITVEEANDLPSDTPEIKPVERVQIPRDTSTPEQLVKALTTAPKPSKKKEEYVLKYPETDDVEVFKTKEDFQNKYLSVLQNVRDTKAWEANEKRSKMHAFEVENKETLELVGPLITNKLREKRINHNKGLAFDETLEELENKNE